MCTLSPKALAILGRLVNAAVWLTEFVVSAVPCHALSSVGMQILRCRVLGRSAYQLRMGLGFRVHAAPDVYS